MTVPEALLEIENGKECGNMRISGLARVVEMLFLKAYAEEVRELKNGEKIALDAGS